MSSIIETSAFLDTTTEPGVIKPVQTAISDADKAAPGESPIFGVKLATAGDDGVKVESPKGAYTSQVNTGAGDDTITGSFIADTLNAGAGNDLIEGGKGADRISGGDGNDTLYGDSASGIPGIVRDGNDTIFGGAGDDLIFGGDGDDSLFGGTGNDTIFGDAGNDTIFGGAGNDSIVGGAGDDVLQGGAGDDTLTGGEGADIFRIINDTLDGAGVDTITDFTKDEDVIKLIGFGSTDNVTAEDGKVKVNGTEVADFDPTGQLDLTATFNEENNIWEIL
jgi:Ca2+-binding RTX toxin-like protein